MTTLQQIRRDLVRSALIVARVDAEARRMRLQSRAEAAAGVMVAVVVAVLLACAVAHWMACEVC